MSDHTPADGRASRDPRLNDGGNTQARSGSVVAGRYQVDKLIARGGMATVYLAHQVGLNRPVALKVLAPPPDADDAAAFEERFHLEARSLASLNHANIVTVYDFGETDDGRYYLAMEFVDGPKFSDLLRDGPMPMERAIPLIMQVCTGLRYAHKRHVVHRDLKPSNILVAELDDGEPQVKLVDFGLVKLTVDDQSITRAGLILGSPHCMAPEQVRGVEVDQRADVYAVGVLLFRTLTGHYPFHGPNSAATMIAHLNEPVPTFFSVAPHIVVAEGLEDIVRRCLAKNPRDRFANMRELMEALAGCMNFVADPYRSISQASSAQSHPQFRRQVNTPNASGVHTMPSAQRAAPSGAHLMPSGAYMSPSGAHRMSSGGYPAPSGPYPSPSGAYPSNYVSGAYSSPSGARSMPSGVRSMPSITPQPIHSTHSGIQRSTAPQQSRSRFPMMAMAFGVGTAMFLGALVLGAALGGVIYPGGEGEESIGLSAAPQLGAVLEPVIPAPSEVEAAPEPPAAEAPPPAPPARPRNQPRTRPRPAPAPTPARTRAPAPRPAPAVAAAAEPEPSQPNEPEKPTTEEVVEAPEGYMGMPEDLFK